MARRLPVVDHVPRGQSIDLQTWSKTIDDVFDVGAVH